MLHRLAVVAALVVLAGCGGGSDQPGADRPSADELADAIRGGSSGLGVAADDADCVAQVVVDSHMSDQALQRYLGGPDDDFDEADSQAFDEVLGQLESECGVSPGGG